MPSRQEVYAEISPSEFFYRNRELAGFSNPARGLYSAVRELVENSLDACDLYSIPPHVKAVLEPLDGYEASPDPRPYRLIVEDNGPGVEAKQVPNAFAKVFYGTKFVLRQSRGMFGMGGTMTILYGQITTHRPVEIETSTDGKAVHSFQLMIDIQSNQPLKLREEVSEARGYRGTRVKLCLEGDYSRAAPKILEYFKQTAMATPYAHLQFTGPDGGAAVFSAAATQIPPPPRETLPHPHGLDVEALRRLFRQARERDLIAFLSHNFHRVGERIALKFLTTSGFEPASDPRSLGNDEIVALARALHSFEGFLPPDAGCLSPLGEALLEAGIRKELQPEFSTAVTRPPSAYSGYPFIVEAGLAYGGSSLQPGIKLYRLTNRIPLLYDEGSDVSWKVVHEGVDWKWYRIPQDAPIAIVTHICSTRIPYKTVGKEYVADRPEVERELRNGVREVLRRLSIYLGRKGSLEMVQRRLNIYGKYLPLMARFSTELSRKNRPPRYRKLLGETKSAG